MFRWTNESVPVRVCPKQDILNMYNSMKNQGGNTVAPELVRAFQVNSKISK